ncbi:hypothetical protein LRS05_13455 [Flavobacterium sp. J372]|uniref:hypothetical protein n=1 Tax=Flavobacterium sp. J372 TaxID=2898436 RepID=UPI002151742B|nr:hypothetical protein [Flavobacterium sp. J372]MCR5863071.1 hypothetical protein [Flavobacterium sp. J372]
MPTTKKLVQAHDLTFGPREIETVSQVIFDRVYNESDLTDYHDIETGVDTDTQIVFAKRMALLGKEAGINCEPSEAEGFTFTQKMWTPVTEDFRLKHCQADMPALARVFRKAQRMNPDFYDAVGSKEFGIVIAGVEASLVENIHRKVWFNDKDADYTAEGGVFKANTDLDYFNSFDGLFKQIMTSTSSQDDDKVTLVPIDKNGAASYTAQANLGADYAIDIFEKMLLAADERLLAADDAFILATRSLAENYRATLRNKNLGAGFLEVVEEGRPKLYFDGIEIKVRYDWDRYIKTYQDSGTKWNLPHRAVFTTKSNIPVGTLNEQDLAKLDVFYDRTAKMNIIDAAYTLDAKLLENYMMVAAY